MNKTIDNISINRDAAVGGALSVQGDSVIAGNLKVSGWLDAPNIKGVCKGFFADADTLRRTWPKPVPGWWAVVGESWSAATVYRVTADTYRFTLEWADTGTPAPPAAIDVTPFDNRLDGLETRISSAVDSCEALGARVDSVSGRVAEAETLQPRLETLETVLDGHRVRLTRRAGATSGWYFENMIPADIGIVKVRVLTDAVIRNINICGSTGNSLDIHPSADYIDVDTSRWHGDTMKVYVLLDRDADITMEYVTDSGLTGRVDSMAAEVTATTRRIAGHVYPAERVTYSRGSLNWLTGEVMLSTSRVVTSPIYMPDISALADGYRIINFGRYNPDTGEFVDGDHELPGAFSDRHLYRFTIGRADEAELQQVPDDLGLSGSERVLTGLENRLASLEGRLLQPAGTVHVDPAGRGDYTSLVEALQRVEDSDSRHITIIVHPGVYDMPPCIHNGQYAYRIWRRNLSIIGTDPNQCILRGRVGYYNPYTPGYDYCCLRLSGKVYVANLTMECSHEQYTAEAATHAGWTDEWVRAYCLHVDSDVDPGDVMEVHNCRMVNRQGACIGIGLKRQFTLRVTGCSLRSSWDDTYRGGVHHGALYMHSDPLGTDGQRLEVTRCTLESVNNNIVMGIGGDYGGSATLLLQGNLCRSTANTFTISGGDVTLDSFSLGNNIPAMNAAA